MARVIGIDPGTISLDLCGLDAGRVFLDESIATEDALADPSLVLGLLERASPLDLVVGPSGYGLPLRNVRDISESDLRLACLAPRGESGGIGGLSSLMRALAQASVPVLVTPGVVHLDLGSGAPEDQPRGYGHRGQGLRRCACYSRPGAPAWLRCAGGVTRSSWSWEVPSARQSPSSMDASSTASADRQDLLVRPPAERSTARSRSLQVK